MHGGNLLNELLLGKLVILFYDVAFLLEHGHSGAGDLFQEQDLEIGIARARRETGDFKTIRNEIFERESVSGVIGCNYDVKHVIQNARVHSYTTAINRYMHVAHFITQDLP